MKRFDLLLKEDKSELYRVLDVQENNITVIACLHKSMPVKVLIESLSCFYKVEESKLFEFTGLYPENLSNICLINYTESFPIKL